MARTPARKPIEQDNIADPFDDIVTAFRGVLGEMGQGEVKIFVKPPKETKFSFLRSEPIGDGDFDTFIAKVRADYPAGGEFLFRLCDDKGMIRSTKTLSLAPLPVSEQIKLERRGDRDNSGNNEILLAVMNNQQNSSNQMMTMMITMMSTMQQSTTNLIAAIVPAMANKSESASEMLAHLTTAQKNMLPPPAPEKNSMKEAFEMISLTKSLLGDGGGGNVGEGGLGDLLKMATPLIAAGMASAGQNSQTAQIPQQAPVAQILQQAPQVIAQPIPQTQIQPQTEQDQAMLVQMQLIQRYEPLMKAIKNLLIKGANENRLYDFLADKLDAGEISEDDFASLETFYKEQPGNLPVLLNMFGISSPQYVDICAKTLDQFAMDPDNDSAGSDGDKTDTDVHGTDGGGGIA
jgi:hypothetical protein